MHQGIKAAGLASRATSAQCTQRISLATYQPKGLITMSTRRYSSHSVSQNQPQQTAPASKAVPQPFPKSTRNPQLPEALSQYLTSALRVNHAGELAATLIYAAQNPPIINRHPGLRPLVTHMHEQEVGHFDFFNKLLADKRIRPTAMYPIWQAAATTLGWATGVMGKEAAMACTEAVETEIGEHYNAQVKVLGQWVEEMEDRAQRGEVKEGEAAMLSEIKWLVGELRRIRDEELEHLDHAVEGGAKMAKPYEILNGVIRIGCRGAIWVSERV